MKKFVWAVALVCAAIVGQPQEARAQAQVTVDVDIDLPDFLVLYCYSAIDVTIGAAAISTALTDGDAHDSGVGVTPAQSVTPTASGSTLTATVGNLTTDMGTLTTTATLELDDICAVRGITSTGQAAASIDGTSPLTAFTDGGTSTIGASGVVVSTAAPDVTLGTPTPFGVSMDLDFSSTTTSGIYQADNDLVVVATAP